MNQEKNLDAAKRDTTNQRMKAKAAGLTKYFTGLTCRKGHVAERTTHNGMCCACQSEKSKASWAAGVRQNPTIRVKANRKWNTGEKARVAKQKWLDKNPKRAWAVRAASGAKHRAGWGNLPYDITHKYVESITPDICPVFGTPFIFTGSKVLNPASATLDRLDPKKGYVKGNVVVISMKANSIKNAYGARDIRIVSDWLAQKGYY